MKTTIQLLCILFTLSFADQAIGQSNDCPYFNKYIKKGDTAFKKKKFEAAINAYTTAMVHCPKKAKTASVKIKKVHQAINTLRRTANKNAKAAQKSAKDARIAKANAEENAKAAEIAQKKAEKSAKRAKRLQENIKIIDEKTSPFQFLFKNGLEYFVKGDYQSS
mgnify:CR=1 FL=1